MLKHRIIPVVLIDGFSVLKTINFETRRNLGSPITVARTYNTRNVDELILLDIDASKQNRSIDIFTINEIAKECFMPLTVGGGIKTLEDIEKLLSKGADKVALNTIFLEDFNFLKSASESFGNQCMVASVDVILKNGTYKIFSHLQQNTEVELFKFCKDLEKNGAGEILLNSVDRDGQMKGMDFDLIKKVSDTVNIPVIACGGVSRPQDCSKAIKFGASAVGASSIFHFTNFTPNDCRDDLLRQGIPARKANI